jgi:outer membrane protein assembly factor BamB
MRPAAPVAAQVNQWNQLHPSARAPQALQWASGAYDPREHRMLVFGGTDQVDDFYDVWALNLPAGNETWSLLRPYGNPPLARRQSAAAYDTEGRRLIIFGGYSAIRGAALDDTWMVDFSSGDGTWRQHTPGATKPAPRRSATLVYQELADPPTRRMILFGGYNATTNFNDVWAFDLREGHEGWSKLTPCNAPPLPRDGHTAVYDAAHGRMIVYGGWYRVRTDTTVGDTWALDLTPGAECWSELHAGGTTMPLTAPATSSSSSHQYPPCAATSPQLIPSRPAATVTWLGAIGRRIRWRLMASDT